MAAATQVQISEMPRELHKISESWFLNQKKIYTHELPLCTGWAFVLPSFPTQQHLPTFPRCARWLKIIEFAPMPSHPSDLKHGDSCLHYLLTFYFEIIAVMKNSKKNYKECLNTLHPDSPNTDIYQNFFIVFSLYIYVCIYICIHTYTYIYMHVISRDMFSWTSETKLLDVLFPLLLNSSSCIFLKIRTFFYITTVQITNQEIIIDTILFSNL